jgi:hypothetical protein
MSNSPKVWSSTQKEADMPVRKVSNRGGNAVGRFPSTKMGRMIAFESLLERDFIYLIDYDSAVEWFEEQPLSIEYLHESKLLHYTPDFHLLESGQHVLVECKPEWKYFCTLTMWIGNYYYGISTSCL